MLSVQAVDVDDSDSDNDKTTDKFQRAKKESPLRPIVSHQSVVATADSSDNLFTRVNSFASPVAVRLPRKSTAVFPVSPKTTSSHSPHSPSMSMWDAMLTVTAPEDEQPQQPREYTRQPSFPQPRFEQSPASPSQLDSHPVAGRVSPFAGSTLVPAHLAPQQSPRRKSSLYSAAIVATAAAAAAATVSAGGVLEQRRAGMRKNSSVRPTAAAAVVPAPPPPGAASGDWDAEWADPLSLGFAQQPSPQHQQRSKKGVAGSGASSPSPGPHMSRRLSVALYDADAPLMAPRQSVVKTCAGHPPYVHLCVCVSVCLPSL